MSFAKPTMLQRLTDGILLGLAVGLITFAVIGFLDSAFLPRPHLPLWTVACLGSMAVPFCVAYCLGVNRIGFVFIVLAELLILLSFWPVHAAEVAPTSVRYRFAVQRAAGEYFGLDAPVARLAAQLQTESGWNPKAESVYAQGLAQFTPSTAKWLPQICPEVGPPDAWDPQWSIRAMACYDRYLYARISAANECNRWAFTLSDYNGGTGNRQREQAITKYHDHNPKRWFGGVEDYSSRNPAAFRENRHYVREILLNVEPAFINAGWPGQGVCL